MKKQLDPTQEKWLRWGFRQMNKCMLLMWRLGLGRFLSNPQVGYIMVLVTTGHKSGLKRYAPANFEQDGQSVYCLPGMGARTHWYRNLMADPHCEVWLPDGRWHGVAEEVAGEAERLPLLRRVLVRSGFAAKLFEGIDPAYLSNDHLRELGARYEKLLKINLIAPCAGPGGPGDLAWVWAVLGLVFLAWLLLRRRK
ncbi:MAG: nitroreductase family deazaflavin-dependent oxidoreductase [Anaerolineae bacterium]|nr:nitroreductase family deazaflavin-dependent oxidoreductase [Anaerolineae bacterium]